MIIENFDLTKAASSLINRKQSSHSSRISQLKSISNQQIDQQNNLIANFTFKLVDLNEIKYNLEVKFFSFISFKIISINFN